MSVQLRYSNAGYTMPIPPVLPMISMGEVAREVRAHQPAQPLKKKRPSFTGDEILGVAKPLSVDELRRDANLHFLENNWIGTIDSLERLIQIEPTSFSYFMLGMCYVNVGDYPNAIWTLEEAARLQPNHFMTQFHLGSAYLMLFIRTGDKKELEKAIQPYKKVIALGQERVDIAFLTLGFIYSLLREWRNAEKYYQKAIELGHDPSSAYQQLAKLYMDMGDEQLEKKETYYLKAAQMLKKQQEITPQNSDAYNFLGHVYQMIRRSELAAQAYEKAIQLDEHNLLALANLTAVYLDAERYEEARDLHRRIIGIKPQVIKNYLVGKLQRPERDVRRFRSDSYLGYGVACMELHRIQAGSDDAENSTGTANPTLLQEAEKALKKAIDIDSDNANAYYDLAVLYYRLNRPEEAQATIRQALAIDPNDENIKAYVQKLLEEQLRHRLLARGAIKEIKKPITDFSPYRNRTMMHVSGKPLSQLIVEERR